MNKKKNLLILGCVVLLLFVVVVVAVSKAFGSNAYESISGCSPYNVSIQKGSDDHTANISWYTKDSCSSFIVYGEDSKDLKLVAVDITNGAKSKVHSVDISYLLSSKAYYFSIVSDGQDYGKSGLPISFVLSSL